MQEFMSRLLVAVASCALAIPLPCQAAELVKLRVNVQQEKRNVVVKFKNAAIGQVAVPSDASMNAFIGVTSDFGESLPVYILLKEGMPDDDAMKYAEHQGKNYGEAQCALVQKGSSPDVPSVSTAVLAQNCTLLSAKY